MSRSERRRGKQLSTSKGQEIRIDGAHPLGMPAESAVPPTEPEPVAVTAAASESEQLYSQATQLAAHLKSRQENLDRRESQLNARLAQIDQGARAARLWVSEREAELLERQSHLDRREEDLRAREAEATTLDATARQRLAVNAEELTGREEKLAAWADELAQRERRLEESQAQLRRAEQAATAEHQSEADNLTRELQQFDAYRAATEQRLEQMRSDIEKRRASLEAEEIEQSLRVPAELVEREKAAAEKAEALNRRWQQMEQAEARLAEAQAQNQELARALEDKRQRIDEAAKADRRRLAEEKHRLLAELEDRRRAVQRRAEHIDQSRAALKQVREELLVRQRETLEIRLATEELWAELAGAAPPASLTRSLAETRARLAAHYRLAAEELQRERDDLEAIRAELAEQHDKVCEQKQHFDHWAESRRAEVEQMAERLVARERQLHEQQASIERTHDAWQLEKLDLEKELRQLRLQLPDELMAVA